MINDDPRLSALVREGSDGEVVLVGVPFDYSRKRTINKGGQENGPCCLRRFIPKVGPLVNPEYDIDIRGINVTDYGNIQFKEKQDSLAPEKVIVKISQQISHLLNSNQLPFVLGGAKEGTYAGSLAFRQRYQKSHHILIAGRPTLKRPYDGSKLTSDNLMTLLGQHNSKSLTVFGPSMRYFPKEFNKNFELISYQSIRQSKIVESEHTKSQAGFVFNSLLESMKGDKVHVSLSVEAIERFRGCRDVLALGLTVEQIIQIFFVLGASRNVLLVDICEFNPSVEDYESSLLLMNLFYYFLMGWTLRPK